MNIENLDEFYFVYLQLNFDRSDNLYMYDIFILRHIKSSPSKNPCELDPGMILPGRRNWLNQK